MNDLISRQSAIDALCSACGFDCDKSEFVYDGKQEEQVILCPEHYALTQLPLAQLEQAVKDCRNCKHGKYNDYHDTYFCYNQENCSNWDKWETSAQPERKWIPCSERLPTLADGKDVLVNVISDDRVYDIILASVETVETVYRKGWINAWMPLPEPYRGDDHE